MNKLGIVLGAAAVAIVAGCMDPNYVRPNNGHSNTVKHTGGTTPALTPDVKPVADEELPGYPGKDNKDGTDFICTITDEGCTCAPGTVHEGPCTCGAPDCKCAVVPPPPPPPPPAPVAVADGDVTTYVVRPGDTLFLISKRFNVKLDSIRKANPQVKNDAIRAGQKITIPAKVELGKYAEPLPQPAPVKKEFVPYNGPTVEYVVKNGDCVSRLAAKHGITTKQFMTLNNLSDSNIRIGQKVLLPATAAAPVVAKADKPAPKKEAAKVTPPVAKVEPVEEVLAVVEPAKETLPAEKPVEEAKAAPSPAPEASGDYVPYVVMKGEDITAISISFGIDTSVIREINNMRDEDDVVPGQTIRLPAEAL